MNLPQWQCHGSPFLMPPQHHQNPAYAEPVLRASSPSSSFSTTNGADQSMTSEDELSDAEFHAKMEQDIGLGQISLQERLANEGPLIRVPNHYYDHRVSYSTYNRVCLPTRVPDTSEAEREQIERSMYRAVLISLRKRVADAEEEQRFEETMKKSFIRPAEQKKPSDATDLASLLQSMMTSDSASHAANSSISTEKNS